MKKPKVQKSSDIAQHIDPSKKVRVYRNLHKKCFSVKQDGVVRCHAEQVTLRDCKFIVSKAGQKRVREECRKNVHAFVEGYVLATTWDSSDWEKAYYNPYTCDTFINQYDRSPLETATFADLYVDPVSICVFN